MIETTKAFVLSYLKYGDTSLIVRCFTEKFGCKSFMLKGAFSKKNKKHHYLFCLNEIEISFYPKKNEALELVKNISQGQIFETLHTDVFKSSILTFLGEILNQNLKNEKAQDVSLYNFLKNSLTAFDKKSEYFADFHLFFLLEFSKHLGFYPLEENSTLPYFNLQEGIFSLRSKNISNEENAVLWTQLLQYDFAKPCNCFTSTQRTQMLEEILNFYEFHQTNFRKPLSLEVLKVVFS